MLSHIDQKLKQLEASRLKCEMPQRYWSNLVRVSGAGEFSYILEQLLAKSGLADKKLNCLVVGVYGGRDYWHLKGLGHNVTGLDISHIEDCPNTKIGSAEEQWPFQDATFDLIVMAEILEHLSKDHTALSEANRVLKSSGRLLVTVPYLHSEHPCHIRIHNPQSIKHLLAISGFEITEYLERPGLIQLSLFNYIVALLSITYHLLTKKSSYHFLVKCFGRFEWKMGQKMWVPRKLMKTFKWINWGGICLCKLSKSHLNHQAQNIKEYSTSD